MWSYAPWISLFGALAVRVAAQNAIASNATAYRNFDNDTVQLVIDMPNASSLNTIYTISPLTPEAYLRLPHDPQDKGYIGGNSTAAVLWTPGSPQTASALQPDDIAYISCDDSDYAGNIGMETTISMAVAANVTGIIFYSKVLDFCNVTGNNGSYTFMYTMTSPKDAVSVFDNLTHGLFNNTAYLISGISWKNNISPPYPIGGAGTTAVAMIILYSITGVITALFLVIIITGAVRAHRHPERYGPRNVMGRTRQSRAKGIARAMLDTIPIVKFGENNRPAGKDVEQNPATIGSHSHELASRDPGEVSSTNNVAGPFVGPGSIDAASVAAGATTAHQESDRVASEVGIASSSATDAVPVPEEETQGCSICTDDFERGQDIRVLPCGHQFHPACVDPWLLDISGTCPLCRVHLNPQAAQETVGDELPPPLDPESADAAANGASRRRDAIRHFFARGRDGADLSSANREERLDALRRWRQANRERNVASTAPGERVNASGAGVGDAHVVDPASVSDDAAERQSDERRGPLSKLSRLIRRR